MNRAASACTYVPDSEENKRRREQQSQHITKGRECERHYFASARRIPADDAGSLATVCGLVASSSSVVLM